MRVFLVFTGVLVLAAIVVGCGGSGREKPPLAPPSPVTVSISSPARGSNYPNGSDVDVTATATSSNGSITNVELYSNNVLAASDNTSGYAFTLHDLSQGTYYLKAKAYDSSGNVNTSSETYIVVNPPETGWTKYKEDADTQVVYVSSSTGSDLNNGLSEDYPVATIAAGRALIRDGQPDWLLLRRGDTWTNESFGAWEKSAATESETMLIGAYGDTDDPRPHVKTGTSCGIRVTGSTGDNRVQGLAIAGVHFEAHSYTGTQTDPDTGEKPVGILWHAGTEGARVEDCRVTGYRTGIDVSEEYSRSIKDFYVYRSVITDCYEVRTPYSDAESFGVRASGVNGFVVWESVFIANGWKGSAAPRNFNSHSIFADGECTNVDVRRNVIIDSSYVAIYSEPGGYLRRNILQRNPCQIVAGIQDVETSDYTEIENNAAVGGCDVGSQSVAEGIIVMNVHASNVRFNLLANDQSSGTSGFAIMCYGHDQDVFTRNTRFNWNVIHNWTGGFEMIGVAGEALKDIYVRYNVVQDLSGASTLAYHRDAFSASTFEYRRNSFYLGGGASMWFNIAGVDKTYYQWENETGENGTNRETKFINGSADLASYHGYIARTATLDSFVEEIRKQRRYQWRYEYTWWPLITYLKNMYTEN